MCVLCRWLYSVADDFFTKQLPHNVTWGLTVLYALDASKDLNNLGVQVKLYSCLLYTGALSHAEYKAEPEKAMATWLTCLAPWHSTTEAHA